MLCYQPALNLASSSLWKSISDENLLGDLESCQIFLTKLQHFCLIYIRLFSRNYCTVYLKKDWTPKQLELLTPKNINLKWFELKGMTIFLPLHHIYRQGLQRQQPEQHPDEIKALHQLQLAISSPLNNKKEEEKQPISKKLYSIITTPTQCTKQNTLHTQYLPISEHQLWK